MDSQFELESESFTFSYQDMISALRDMTLSGESDLHIQADAAPYKRNLQRKLENIEGSIVGQPLRIVPESVVNRLAYLVSRGTSFLHRLFEFEQHLTTLRKKYQSTCVDLDEEFHNPSVFGGVLDMEQLSEEDVAFVFHPFDVPFEVVTHTEDDQLVCGRYRVHVFRAEPMTNLGSGLCLSFRRIWPILPSFRDLGFSQAATNLVVDMMTGNITSGLVLVVGATGSGKSTTVAAMLDAINEHLAVNITLLEDPPEYKFQNKKARFRQIYVGRDVPSYAEGAHHALRQDPDIIVVGEIRDKDMAQRALAIAKTGHLVIGTMHSSTNAPAALAKFLQMVNFDHHGLSHHIQGIIAQKILESKDEYIEGHAALPVLIQEVIRPQKNPAIRRLLQTRSENPVDYYQLIGRENTDDMVIEENFETALEKAVETKRITLQTARKALERDEDLAINRLVQSKKSRSSGKHAMPEYLRNRDKE